MSGASIVENLFKKVSKDADGFENVDEFWETANVLKYPMIKPIESYLNKCSEEYMKALTGNKFASETDPGSSTDDDFDYEDNESFTDASDEDSLVSDDEAPQIDVSIALTPESKRGRSSVSTAGTKGTLNESLPLEDTMNSTVHSESRRVSRSQYSADESNNNVSVLSTVTTPGGKGGKAAAAPKERGRSSVGLNDSGVTANPNSSQDETSSPEGRSSVNTSTRSGRTSQTKSTRQSDSEDSSAMITPVSKATRGSKSSAPNTMDTNLSAPFSAAASVQQQQGGRTPASNRRVSFGNLSPIDRGSSVSKKDRRSTIGSINDPSTDVSRATSAASEGGAAGEEGDPYDAYDNDGDMYFDEEPDERMVSMESSVHTPQTNKSVSRTSRGGSNATTPASAASGKSSNNTSSASASASKGGRTPRTPESVMHLSQIDTPKTGEMYRGITLPDESYVQDEDEDTDREEDASRLNTTRDSANTSYALDESSFMDNSFLYTISEKNPNYFGNKEEVKAAILPKKSLAISSKKRKVYTSDEEDAAHDLGINSDDSDDDGGKRRSKRATKGQKFAFWKGERPIYEHGTLVGINAASKTPVKPKSRSKLSGVGSKSSKHKLLRDVDGEASGSEEEQEEVKPKVKKESKITLPKGMYYVDRAKFNTVQTWNEERQDVVDQQVVRRVEELEPSELKPSRPRPGNTSRNCSAVQMLVQDESRDGTMSAWVSGRVELPPKGIKDEEQVGKFNIIFAISECQNDAVELAIANPESMDWDAKTAQRMMLKKGDTFFVPPGNIYRLENHSTTIPATLFFTIIKPVENVVALNAAAPPEEVY